jgi:hypothetical protein
MKEKLLKWLYMKLNPKTFTGANPHLDAGSKRYYASELLNNPLYQEIMSKIEVDCLRLWQNSPVEAFQDRETLHMHYRVLKQIDAHVRRYVADAAYTEMEKQMTDKLKASV